MSRLFWMALGLGTGAFLAQARAPQTPAPRLPYAQLDLLAETYGQIREHYVEPVPADRLFRGAIEGMVQALDPHSALLDPDAVAQFHADAHGEFAGVGMEVAIKRGWLTVVAPLAGTPAERAGLQPKDRIEAIDGLRTRGQSMRTNGQRLRGEPGTTVVLTIRRAGRAPFDVTITRALIRIEPVVVEPLPHDLALIRIRTFQRNTADRLDAAIARLKPKGIVLDLRNNPGGLVQAAVDVADRFLDGGVVVSSRGRAENRTWSAHAGTFTDAPIVVLVNAGTASAAEIVAGALQDRNRARVLGTPTFGKGSIQTLFGLSDGSGVKLTIARYHLPSGRAIQAEGLVPDVSLDPPGDDPAPMRERDLPGRLDGAKVDTARPLRDKAPMPAPSPATPQADPWIGRAIELLHP